MHHLSVGESVRLQNGRLFIRGEVLQLYGDELGRVTEIDINCYGIGVHRLTRGEALWTTTYKIHGRNTWTVEREFV